MAYKDKLSSVNTNLISFYLATDSALGKWEDNNTFFKPQFFYRISPYEHTYTYYPGNPSGQKLFLSFILRPDRILQRMEESLAYAARSSTKAVGAERNAHGSNAASINMEDFGYENEHSAFWSFTLQVTKPAYDKLMDKLRVEHNP